MLLAEIKVIKISFNYQIKSTKYIKNIFIDEISFFKKIISQLPK